MQSQEKGEKGLGNEILCKILPIERSYVAKCKSSVELIFIVLKKNEKNEVSFKICKKKHCTKHRTIDVFFSLFSLQNLLLGKCDRAMTINQFPTRNLHMKFTLFEWFSICSSLCSVLFLNQKKQMNWLEYFSIESFLNGFVRWFVSISVAVEYGEICTEFKVKCLMWIVLFVYILLQIVIEYAQLQSATWSLLLNSEIHTLWTPFGVIIVCLFSLLYTGIFFILSCTLILWDGDVELNISLVVIRFWGSISL